MAEELSIFNLKFHVVSSKLDLYRRDLKNGARIFLLTKKEISKLRKTGFPEESNNFKEYMDIVCEITGCTRKDFNSVGFDTDILIIQKTKK